MSAEQPHRRPGPVRRLGIRFQTAGQFLAATGRSPYWWLLPFCLLLLVLAILLIIAHAFPGVAPFVYAIF